MELFKESKLQRRGKREVKIADGKDFTKARMSKPFLDSTAGSWTQKAGRDEHERVPSMDADLFDVVAGRPEKRDSLWTPAWAGALGLDEVSTALAAPTAAKAAAKQQGRARERYWNSESDSDVFAVPEISPPPAKRARPPSFWGF
ncbi:hypothetical protein ACP70R_043663 [Stipagrostis hirtigluma subsp. patula]